MLSFLAAALLVPLVLSEGPTIEDAIELFGVDSINDLITGMVLSNISVIAIKHALSVWNRNLRV